MHVLVVHRGRSLFLILIAPGLAALLLGCAGTAARVTDGGERISFQPSPPPFCGRCETVSFTARADGEVRIEKGYWAGSYRDWRRVRSVKHVTAEQFAEFKRRLATYKPRGDLVEGPGSACKSYLTDDAGLTIEWFGDGVTRRRVFDFGCQDDLVMNKTLLDAPQALGL